MKKKLLVSVLALAFTLLTNVCEAQYSVLFNFNSTYGEYPWGSLIQSGNKLYGMTNSGGSLSANGTVFSMNTNGSGYKVLENLNDLIGDEPYGSLILSGNRLFGITYYGGANGYGNIFSIDTNGNGYKDLHDFNTSEYIYGSLTLSGRRLFGMDYHGFIFSLDSNGSGFRHILNFTGPNGAGPLGDLTLSSSGRVLYGMTGAGGAFNNGCIFSIDTAGNSYKKILDFTGANGSDPKGDVLLLQNKLYGMTYSGGANDSGCIFSIDTNGNGYKKLVDFSKRTGYWPNASLCMFDSVLLGMTEFGGALGYGVIFSVDTSGSGYNDMHDFDRVYGGLPTGSLIVSGKMLYGMTEYYGQHSRGVAFRYYTNCNLITSANVVSMPLCNGNNTGSAIANPSGGTLPYTFLWSPSGGTTAIASGLTAGSYTVSVQDANGCSATAAVIITQPAALTASIYPPFNVSCNGGNNGSASANANGGTPPYTYSWSNSQTTANASLLSAGTYTLTVTDSCGASSTATVNVTQPTPIVIVADSIADNGGCNGAAWVHVSGGDSNYTYKWTGGNTTDSIYSQCYGYYCCVVTDGGLCKDSVCININLSTGINKLIIDNGQLTVYPNPNKGIFTIAFGHPDLVSGSQTIEIYNVLGERIIGMLKQLQQNNLINMSKQPNGVYFYRVLKNDGSVLGEGKIVIEK